MADIGKLKTALRAAHDAGDTASAQRIARMIKGASGGPETAAAPVPRLSGGADGVDFGLPDGYEALGTFSDGGVVYRSPSGALGAKSKGGSTNDPETVKKIMEGQGFAKVMADRIDNERIDANPIAARGQEFIRGTPFVGSYLDEAVGLVSPDAAENMRKTSEAMQRQNPWETTGLNLAGGLTGAVVGAAAAPAVGLGNIAANSGRLGKVAAGAAAGLTGGALEGAVYGYGEQGADGQQRGNNALAGGAIGGALGGFLGAVGPLAQEAISGAWARVRGDDVASISKELGVSKEAAQQLRNKFNGSNFDAMADDISRAGPDGMLADAGMVGRIMTDNAASNGGIASQIVEDAMSARVGRSTADLNAALDQHLGAASGNIARTEGVMKGSADARKAAYDAFEAVEIDWRSPAGERLRQLIEAAPEEALSEIRKMRDLELPAYRSAVPDGAYAADAAPAPKTEAGSWLQGAERELAEYDAAVSQARPPQERSRPLVGLLRERGGVDPSGSLAEELRAQGITTRTHPALFKRGGLRDADNLPIADYKPDQLARLGLADDGNGYISPQSIADGVRREMDGGLAPSAEREAFDGLMGDERYYSELRDEVARVKALPDAPPVVGDAVPAYTARDIDQMKRGFDHLADKNRNEKTGALDAMGQKYASWSREIRDTLTEVSPSYEEARALGKAAINERQAVDLGERILNNRAVTREEVARELQGMTARERQLTRESVRAAWDERLANVKRSARNPDQDGVEALQALKDSSRANRDKLRTLLGGKSADDLFTRMDRALKTFEMRQALAVNSKTAQRMRANQEAMETAAGGPLRRIMAGEPFQAGKQLLQALSGETPDARQMRQDGLYADIAKALTGSKGPDAVRALRAIEQAIQTQAKVSPQRAKIIADGLRSIGYGATTAASGEASRN